jgi:TolB-like protein
MSSIIEGYNYDIFISYRQKDNKYDGWVTEFVDNLRRELEATFKEDVTVYFDINPHDGLLENHDVYASLEEKLKCLIFIPVISRTYCDPKSFAWEHEFKAFIDLASQDQLGLKVKLPYGNVAGRILPIQIHDLDAEDKTLIENELGGFLRGIEFIYKEPGVNRPLTPIDDEKKNKNGTRYRNQVNKVANAIKEIINAIKKFDQDDLEVGMNVIEEKTEPSLKSKPKIILTSFLIFTMVILGYFFILKLIKSTGSIEKSIAVLPFRNDSPIDSNKYFIDGIMEEITTNLKTINDIRVISRTSVEQFRGSSKPTTPEIAKKLGVNYIVEGSAQKYGNKLLLRVQLIRAAKESQLWAKSYEQEINKVNDLFRIQSQIAQAIAAELEAKITPHEKQLIEKTPTDNPEAYRLYTVGNFFMTQWEEGNFRKAIDNYKQAIMLDSSFAQAYANLASAYFELTMWDVPKPYPELIPQAKAYALKALEIDKNLGEPYFVLGSIKYIHELDLIGAEQAFKKGMQLSPNFVWGRINYANFLTIMRRFEESIAISRQTVKINPLDPGAYNELAYALAHNGQDKEALDLYNKSLELKPDLSNVIGCLTEFYSNKGIFNKFLSDRIDTLLGSPHNDISKISTEKLMEAGNIYAKVGRRIEAISILNELNRRDKEGDSVSSIDMGLFYNALGETEKAIDLIEKGFNKKESWLCVNLFSDGDSIRSNKRFKKLLGKMGFEE